MMRFFLDSNILLDAILERPHDPEEALLLLALGEQRQVHLLTTSLGIAVVLYHLQRNDAAKKGLLRQQVRRTLEDLLACVEVVPVDADHFLQSAASSFGDLEDGAQYFAVAAAGPLDAIVSRDPDFDGHIGVKRLSAKQALRLVKRKK
jgi:predicted nucleic acid-binding protein